MTQPNERVKRKKPARASSDREFPNIFKSVNGSRTGSNGTGGDAGESWSENVTHGVKLGYRVIEEHIRQGQRIAQEVNNRSYSSASMNNDIQEFIQRTQRYVSDCMQLYPGIVEMASSNFASMGEGFGSEVFGNRKNKSSNQGESQQPKVIMVIKAQKSIEINVDLGIGCGDITIDHLHDSDVDKRAITDVKFETISADEYKLHINVDEDQPTGHYHGVILSATTGRPCGTVSALVTD